MRLIHSFCTHRKLWHHGLKWRISLKRNTSLGKFKIGKERKMKVYLNSYFSWSISKGYVLASPWSKSQVREVRKKKSGEGEELDRVSGYMWRMGWEVNPLFLDEYALFLHEYALNSIYLWYCVFTRRKQQEHFFTRWMEGWAINKNYCT